MKSDRPFREQWPWNDGYLRAFTLVPAVLGLGATVILFPIYGAYALWFSTVIPFGLVFRGIYGVVGSKMDALRRDVGMHDGEAFESLMVIGRVQSPGIAILDDSQLTLIPIVGKRRTIWLANVTVLREGRWLPGKYVWGKWAFILSTPQNKRLAFAVAESVGRRWARALRGERTRRSR